VRRICSHFAGFSRFPYVNDSNNVSITNSNSSTCPGTANLPSELAPYFVADVDETLLKSAIASPNQGMLCQAKVYKLKEDALLPLYRAWNSTNPNSKLGHWWGFNLPVGKSSQYRADFEICYQFSPLDKLSQCKLKAGSKIVVGTGQSMLC
jgi:hypothetical protein